MDYFWGVWRKLQVICTGHHTRQVCVYSVAAMLFKKNRKVETLLFGKRKRKTRKIKYREEYICSNLPNNCQVRFKRSQTPGWKPGWPTHKLHKRSLLLYVKLLHDLQQLDVKIDICQLNYIKEMWSEIEKKINELVLTFRIGGLLTVYPWSNLMWSKSSSDCIQ